MRSTFMGLETNKRGLYTQQTALYTTGHNISNANTLGYSRQRVNMEATRGFPGVGVNAGTMPGHLGTGVHTGSIQRIRDSFVDKQYRQETNKFGYWESQSKAISQMEDILTEPSTTGLQKSFSEFWQSLQDVATNPSEAGARAVAIRKGQAVADAFNYMHKSLTQVQTNLGTEIEHTTTDINSILSQIAAVNDQIKNVEPNGYVPNDLYDQRDLLLDELSNLVPIQVDYEPSGGRSVEGVAEGWAVVKLKVADGDPIVLVHGTKSVELETNFGGPGGSVVGITVKNALVVDQTDSSKAEFANNPEDISHKDLIDTGKLKSLMNSYGVETEDPDNPGQVIAGGLYPDMIKKLNEMAQAFAEVFNEVHKSGTDLQGNQGEEFFVNSNDPNDDIDASNISISEALLKNSSLFAASNSGQGDVQEGNGNNAQELANIQFKIFEAPPNGPSEKLKDKTLETYFQGVIGDLGVEGMEANKTLANTITLLGAVESRRASISSVSLDEEMTDMIRFQQAYNASARMITVVDETLDKIINGMGVVGR